MFAMGSIIIYGSFIGITAVSIGTVLKPLFDGMGDGDDQSA